MHLGMMMALAGMSIILGTIWALLITALFFVVTDRWYISFEEAMMARKFGEQYRGYCLQIRRWL